MTEKEIRAAVLAALLDYDSLKKTRRLRKVKQALRGTMMATVIGSTGIMAANQSRNEYVLNTVVATAANGKIIPTKESTSHNLPQRQIIAGVAHFGLNQHTLLSGHNERLVELTKQLPKDTEIVVIGRADAVGGYQYNKKLGKQRALAVANYLASQGFKVKSVGSKVSKYGADSWLNRRVDIVVNHASLKSLAINLPPLIDQYEMPRLGTLVQTKPGFASSGQGNPAVAQLLSRHLKKDQKDKTHDHSEIYGQDNSINKIAKKNETAVTKNIILNPNSKRQKISGVAHFAMHHANLTSAHTERLNLLVKQIPKSAELTVVGRTNSSNVSAYEKSLTKQRALAVANYLASQGVKVSGIGIKPSRKGFTGWAARGVDIVIHHASAEPLDIKLPPLVSGQGFYRRSHDSNMQTSEGLSNSRKVSHISKKMDNVLDRLSVDRRVGSFEDSATWWDDATKANNMRLDKTSW